MEPVSGLPRVATNIQPTLNRLRADTGIGLGFEQRPRKVTPFPPSPPAEAEDATKDVFDSGGEWRSSYENSDEDIPYHSDSASSGSAPYLSMSSGDHSFLSSFSVRSISSPSSLPEPRLRFLLRAMDRVGNTPGAFEKLQPLLENQGLGVPFWKVLGANKCPPRMALQRARLLTQVSGGKVSVMMVQSITVRWNRVWKLAVGLENTKSEDERRVKEASLGMVEGLRLPASKGRRGFEER